MENPPPLPTLEENGTLPVIYKPADAEIATLKAKYTALVADPDAAKTPEGYEAVRVALSEIRPYRVNIEKLRVKLKADALAYGKAVDAEAKRLTGKVEEIELPLKAAKQQVDDATEQARLAAKQAEADRIAAEQQALRDAEIARVYAERKAAQDKIDAFSARLEEERAELKAETDRIKAEQKAAQDKIDADRKQVEEQQRAAQVKIDEANKAIRDEQDRLHRIAFEEETTTRLAKEAEAEAARKAEVAQLLKDKNERDAKEQLELERAEQQRVAEARPDVQKVQEFGRLLRNVKLPDCKSDEAKALLTEIRTGLIGIAARCENFNVVRKATKREAKVAA